MAINISRVACVSSLLFTLFAETSGQSAPTNANGKSTAAPASVPKLPIPSGRYGIGRIGFDWTDAKRRDLLDPEHSRELMVYLWYPTDLPTTVNTRGVYVPGAREMDADPESQHRMRDNFESKWPLIVSGQIYSHAVERAPVANSSAALPLVVFSHGAGGTSFGYTWLIEHLVSHGYVVAAIEHTGSAGAVWFPDGRLAPFREPPTSAKSSPSEQMQQRMHNISTGIAEGADDVRFVLDRITESNKTGAEHFPLTGRIDSSRFAAMGHSAGAEYAARACQLDDRIKVCVDLDGAMVPFAALPIYPDHTTMRQPLLFLEAYHPAMQMGGSPDQLKEFSRVKENQLSTCCPAGAYDVTIRSPGIAHPSFADIPLLLAGEDGYPAPDLVAHNVDLIEKYVLAFLNNNLASTPKSDVFDSPDPQAEIKTYGPVH